MTAPSTPEERRAHLRGTLKILLVTVVVSLLISAVFMSWCGPILRDGIVRMFTGR